MTTRLERDSLGLVEVARERLWGAQTERALQHFHAADERMPRRVIHALAQIKKAAALSNAELGLLPPEGAEAIARAADEVLGGQHDGEFPLPVWQTGSGTQTHMNMNEVLANRASELLGAGRGEARSLHPNDHVNRGQSSNDVFATAMHIAALQALLEELLPSVEGLARMIGERASRFADVIKVGRTHLQDAVPLTVGQEFSAWQSQLELGARRVRATLPELARVPLGGTAVGTGQNAHPRFTERALSRLSEQLGLALAPSENPFEAISAHDALVFAHAAVKSLATSSYKIANDVRWLASGPRAGIGELRLPANEPGSSIMPGKVNPTQCEALMMCCMQVMANDVAVSSAGASGNFQLNVARPLLIHCFLQSCRLLSGALESFTRHAVAGLELDRERIRFLLDRSLMLVTALSPHVGYDAAARIAKRAHEQGSTLREAALAEGISAEDFDRWVRPEDMLGQGRAGSEQ